MTDTPVGMGWVDAARIAADAEAVVLHAAAVLGVGMPCADRGHLDVLTYALRQVAGQLAELHDAIETDSIVG